MLFFIRKSLKTSLSKALDPEQHGLGELSSRVIMDKKVKLKISFHMLHYHCHVLYIFIAREVSVGLPLCIGHLLIPYLLQARSFHIFCFRFHHSSDSLFSILDFPLPIRISVISHIIIYLFIFNYVFIRWQRWATRTWEEQLRGLLEKRKPKRLMKKSFKSITNVSRERDLENEDKCFLGKRKNQCDSGHDNWCDNCWIKNRDDL